MSPEALASVFGDAEREAKYREAGYVVVDWLAPDQVDRLLALHDDVAGECAEYHTSVFTPDPALRDRVLKAVAAEFRGPLERYCPGFDVFLGVYATKAARSTSGGVPLHQDYTFVDPARNASVNIWCPLVDVDLHNGCLQVAPCSHRAFDHLSISGRSEPPFMQVLDVIRREFTVPLEMRAGQAVLYDHRLIHGSGENAADDTRVAVVASAAPRSAQTRIYYSDAPREGLVEVFDFAYPMPVEFMPRSRPVNGAPIEEISYRVPDVGPETIATLRKYQADLQA